MIVTWGDDGKKAEIRVQSGRRKVEVTKDGFKAYGETVELQDGKRRVLTATLVRQTASAPPDKGGDQPPPAKPPTSPRPSETEAVAAIEAIKGSVRRDQDGHVYYVDLDNHGATDSDLSYVRAFPKLKELWIIGGEITDTGLAYLAETPTLENLVIGQDKVTGPGLQVLGKLPHLTRLSLLFLKEDTYSALDLQVIGTCKDLHYVDIGRTTLPAGSLRFLRDLPHLDDLNLDSAHVTDEFLDDIVACKSIETLDLHDTKITEEGVIRLKELPSLQFVNLEADRVTEKVKAAFQKDRPEVTFP